MVSINIATTSHFKLLICGITEPNWEEVLAIISLMLFLHTPLVPLGYHLSVNLEKMASWLITPTVYEFPSLVTWSQLPKSSVLTMASEMAS